MTSTEISGQSERSPLLGLIPTNTKRVRLSERQLPSILIVSDVTENAELLENARRLVAQSYSRLSRTPSSIEEVYMELCRDNYDNHGHSRTIAAMITDPKKENTVIGTTRLVLGVDGEVEHGLQPIDAMNLLNVPNWPHRGGDRFHSKIAELGRFAITEVYRMGRIKMQITKLLYEKAADIAKEWGAENLYAIMPTYVVKLTTEANIKSEEIMGATLNREDPEAERLFNRYSLYWQDSNPRLYRFSDY